MPPRTISILCLLQVVALLGACLFAGWCLKSYRGSLGISYVEGTNWEAYMGAMRAWGLFLLLIPVATAWICAKLSTIHRDFGFIGPDGVWLAVVVTVGVVWFSGVTVVSAISGPFRKGHVRFQTHSGLVWSSQVC